MFRTTLIGSLFLTLTLLTPPVSVSALDRDHARDHDWQVSLDGVWVEPDVGFVDFDLDGDRVEADADSGLGLGIALERRLSSRLGVEVGALFAEPDLGLDAVIAGFPLSASESVSFTAFTAGLKIHLTPDRAVDLYLEPLVAYVLYGDVDLRAQTPDGPIAQSFSSQDEFALGGEIGMEIGLGDSPWSINLATRYIDTRLEVTNEDGEVTNLGFEPFILSAGFGYRF